MENIISRRVLLYFICGAAAVLKYNSVTKYSGQIGEIWRNLNLHLSTPVFSGSLLAEYYIIYVNNRTRILIGSLPGIENSDAFYYISIDDYACYFIAHYCYC